MELLSLHSPHCELDDLINNSDGIIVLTGSIKCLFGELFNKGLPNEIEKILIKLKKKI